MFGIGLSEIIIIGIVALIAIGPERLPEMATKLGRFLWDIRRAWDDVRDTVRSEMVNIKQPFDEVRQATRDTRDMFMQETQKIKTDTESALRTVKDDLKVPEPKSETTAKPAPQPPAVAETETKDPAQETVTTPQPYRPKSPASKLVTYYDLDGNAVEPPAGS